MGLDEETWGILEDYMESYIQKNEKVLRAKIEKDKRQAIRDLLEVGFRGVLQKLGVDLLSLKDEQKRNYETAIFNIVIYSIHKQLGMQMEEIEKTLQIESKEIKNGIYGLEKRFETIPENLRKIVSEELDVYRSRSYLNTEQIDFVHTTLNNPAEKTWFVGRDKILKYFEQFVSARTTDRNIIIRGYMGVGKSSVIKQFEETVGGSGLVFKPRISPNPSIEELFEELGKSLSNALAKTSFPRADLEWEDYFYKCVKSANSFVENAGKRAYIILDQLENVCRLSQTEWDFGMTENVRNKIDAFLGVVNESTENYPYIGWIIGVRSEYADRFRFGDDWYLNEIKAKSKGSGGSKTMNPSSFLSGSIQSSLM